jgi:Tfp pilus assembly protein PilO
MLISSFIKKYNINRDFVLFILVVLAACYLYHDRVYLKQEALLSTKKLVGETLEKDIATLSKADGDFSGKEEHLKTLEKEYEKLVDEQKKLFDKFPSKVQASKMLEDIVSENKFADINFESYYPSDEVRTDSGYSYIPLEVQVSGSFDKMGEYVKYIENLPRIIIIDNIAFQATVVNDQVISSTANLKGKTYVLKY